MKSGICKVCASTQECRRVSSGDILCLKHRRQFYKTGSVLERNTRDKNDYIVKDAVVYMSLYNREHELVGTTLFDEKDLEQVSKHKWGMHKRNGYVFTNRLDKESGKYKYQSLHRFLTNFQGLTDHVNENKLDNRRCNLRVATPSQNIANRKKNKGVYYNKSFDRWVAYITVDYRQIYLGCFEKEEDATCKRRDAEVDYFGSFAPKRLD